MKWTKKVLLLKLITLIFLISWQNVLAQQNGALKGRIVDLTKEGIPIAKVTVKKDGQKYEIKTDKDGKYVLTLPAGTYLLIVSADGFLPSEERQIKILDGQTTETNVTMSITRQTIGCPAPIPESKSETKSKRLDKREVSANWFAETSRRCWESVMGSELIQL
jgi:hypothetical protein